MLGASRIINKTQYFNKYIHPIFIPDPFHYPKIHTMSKTQLSILTEDTWLSEKVKFTIENSNFEIGYSGDDENLLLAYLEKNTMSNHILFVRPSIRFMIADNELNLRRKFKINVLFIGLPLVDDHKPLIHRSNISGYLSINSINKENIQKVVTDVTQKGYYSNEQIPENIWIQNPKGKQELSIPQFTSREQQILNLLCHGFTNGESAEVLHCTMSNIQNHINRIKSKALASSSVELVAISIANKWVNLSREKFKRHNPYILLFTH